MVHTTNTSLMRKENATEMSMLNFWKHQRTDKCDSFLSFIEDSIERYGVIQPEFCN